MSEISSSQRVLLLRELNGELKWFSNGDVKIWIRVFWKMYTNGKYVGEITNGEPSKKVLEGSVNDHTSVIEAKNVSSGLYIIELKNTINNSVIRKKVIL